MKNTQLSKSAENIKINVDSVINDLIAEIEKLEDENQDLKDKIERLESEIEGLKENI